MSATPITAPEGIVRRAMRDMADAWRVNRLLVETVPLTGYYFNWDIRRWQGSLFHHAEPDWYLSKMPQTMLWETREGRLVGVVHPDGPGNACLQIHPDYRALENEMITWAEENLSDRHDDGVRTLDIFVFDYDAPRHRKLTAHGYVRTEWTGVTRRLRFGNLPLPEVHEAEGYRLRTTRPGDHEDCARVAAILNAAFERTIHSGPEIRNFVTRAPCFRHDLDLAMEAPDRSFAAYVGVILDEDNRRGVFEPVCTHPDHRRRRLAQALMFEGLHRLKALHALEVSVETGSAAAANALYESIGFTEAYTGFVWRKAG